MPEKAGAAPAVGRACDGRRAGCAKEPVAKARFPVVTHRQEARSHRFPIKNLLRRAGFYNEMGVRSLRRPGLALDHITPGRLHQAVGLAVKPVEQAHVTRFGAKLLMA